ncbi:hypothetical protein C4577_04545 [Candidatus Parcubacteria bacterium]|nr:MAG: hypothetical protein C4577_04545 [Candidatus Parcubacteria bacterium]
MNAKIFLEELQKIIWSQPKTPFRSNYTENCEGDQLYYCKNMINCFDCLRCADSTYLFDSMMCTNCFDCDYSSSSELCYECVDADKCFNCDFLEDCSSTRDSSYSYGCKNCHNVFGCVGLQNKSYCIFNRQLTEDEYKEKVEKYKNLPPEKILKMVSKIKKLYPRTQTHGWSNENSPYGDYVYNSKNCYMCFNMTNSENSGYLYDSQACKTCYDSTFSGDSELTYEFIDSEFLFNCSYTLYSSYCHDGSYLIYCANVKNCLGCVGLYHKQYCILNRQLTQEEYERISKPLLEELKKSNLGWGNLVF